MRNRATLGTVLVLLVGCARDSVGPGSPEAGPPALPTAPAPPPPPPPAPVLAVFERTSASSTPQSRFVLRQGVQFELQFDGIPAYPGKYLRSDSTITFAFDGWNMMGAWQAKGVLRGDVLVVEFNEPMTLSDFENGEYMRVSGALPAP